MSVLLGRKTPKNCFKKKGYLELDFFFFNILRPNSHVRPVRWYSKYVIIFSQKMTKKCLQKADPMEMIPAGVTSGLKNEMDKNRPYTLVLHAPEESGSETNRALDALTRVELHAEHALESAKVAEQSRLLNEEIAAIQSLVLGHRSFLQGHTSIKTDARIVLHPVGYAKAALKSGVSAIERAEASRQLAAASSDNSLKRNLLAAEIAKIGRIVRGA